MDMLRVLLKKRQFDAISRKSPSEVGAIQQENIKSLLRYVLSHSAFYKNLYSGRGEEDLLKEGFSAIPSIDKQMVMDGFDSLVTKEHLTLKSAEQCAASCPLEKRYKGEFTVIHTSGTSGKVGVFVYDRKSWDSLLGLCLSRVANFLIRIPRLRLAFAGLTEGHHAGVTLISSTPRILAALALCSVNEPLSQMVDRLNRFRPDDLRGYPSGLTMLAQEQLAGRLNIEPKTIVSSAGPLDGRTRHTIEEAFGITPYNFYAASESICIAQDCHLHQGLHVFNDQNVIEIVDRKGQTVEPGKAGEVVLTNLYNWCQPLIRYRMQDIATYSEEECECGLPFPLLKSVGGRLDEVLWFENSYGIYEAVHPWALEELYVPGLHGLQIQQTERNHLKVLIDASGDHNKVIADVSDQVLIILEGKGLQDVVSFEVIPVGSIPPDSRTGKARTIISQIGPPNDI
jgi:phenylacetate-CoA ligase